LRLLREARLEAGLTQLQVARALHQHQSFISKCESGERRVDVVELRGLAQLYQKPVTYFLKF
jgi:transcriptional regulator with XRE-family HTH domain